MMSNYINPFRKKILENKPLIGTNIEMREPVATELFAQLYDFIWIDWEHTWMDRSEIMNHLIAARAGGAAAVVRVPWNDPVMVKPILDMGPDGVVFPMINTAEEARNAVASCTYPPEGCRGFYPIRATNYFSIPTETYIQESDCRIFKIMQLESAEAVKNIDEILAVDGVDCVCIGRADLSGSINKMGEMNDPEVVELCRRAGKAAVAAGVPLMINVGFNMEDIQNWMAMGVSIYAIDSDIGMIQAGAVRQRAALRELIEK